MVRMQVILPHDFARPEDLRSACAFRTVGMSVHGSDGVLALTLWRHWPLSLGEFFVSGVEVCSLLPLHGPLSSTFHLFGKSPDAAISFFLPLLQLLCFSCLSGSGSGRLCCSGLARGAE